MRKRSRRSFCRPGESSLEITTRTPQRRTKNACSAKRTVRRRAEPLMLLGLPFGPTPSPANMYTRALVVKLPSQVKKDNESSQGPMVSARHGIGRCISTQILRASARSSIQSLIMNDTAVSGQTTEKRERYPN